MTCCFVLMNLTELCYFCIIHLYNFVAFDFVTKNVFFSLTIFLLFINFRYYGIWMHLDDHSDNSLIMFVADKIVYFAH